MSEKEAALLAREESLLEKEVDKAIPNFLNGDFSETTVQCDGIVQDNSCTQEQNGAFLGLVSRLSSSLFRLRIRRKS